MEYATEVLDWLKKQAEVAAGRYKRCPAADPSSFTYSAEAKVLGRIVEQLGPLVHPAVVEGCGNAPADVPTSFVMPNGTHRCAVMIHANRFIVDTTRDLCHFKGAQVGTAWKAPNYLTFQDTVSASECIKGMLIPEALERLFPEEQADKRIRAKRYFEEVYDRVFGSPNGDETKVDHGKSYQEIKRMCGFGFND